MTIRTRRRLQSGNTLESMTDDELQQIRFFGSVHSGHALTFTATPEDAKRACEILEARGTLHTIERTK